ncbi:MAG: hypothetical protein HY709_09400 [Candidatus Latescibacteria bacterium]|nr:hypothetical protein [Candidatus Latescibacterota bacterium]
MGRTTTRRAIPKGPKVTVITLDDLRQRLAVFEQRYGMTSQEFYRKVQAGELEEQIECIDWLGYYKFYIDIVGHMYQNV